MKHFLMIATLLLLGSQAQAAIVITKIEGLSRGTGKHFTDQNASVATIYGGLSGDDTDGTCGAAVNTSTCNSCTASSTSCNTTRIHDNLNLTITFHSDSASGNVRIKTDIDSGQTNIDYTGVGTNDLIAANASVVIKIKWSELCDKLFGNSNCKSVADKTKTLKFRLGFDVPATGSTTGDDQLDASADDFTTELQIALADMGGVAANLCDLDTNPTNASAACNFITYPGDQKVFIDDVRAGCDFPGVSGSEADIRAIRVLYEKEAYPSTGAATFADLEVSGAAASCSGTQVVSLKTNEVKGLENNQNYFFRLSLVDNANNVGFFTTHSILDKNDKANTCYDGDQWKQNCHFAAPAKVIGLFEDEFDCFITTATYGSPFKPKVRAFREFRNLFLKPNLLGQLIIRSYYKLSPPVASWIRNHPEVKPVIRALLWPYWIISKILLTGTQYIFILIGLLFLVFSLKLYTKSKRLQ